jgi:5-methylcytosine-specific restriction enzyme A
MPRAPRRCPGDEYQCPELITGSARYCRAHTESWKGERTASSRVTGSAEWQAFRRDILERDGHACQIRYPGICIGYADVVDKIKPAARRPDLAYDPDNARAACGPCNDHKARTEDRR